MWIMTWLRLPGNTFDRASDDGLRHNNCVVVIAASVERASVMVRKQVDDNDVIGPSPHYKRMADAMLTSEPHFRIPASPEAQEAILVIAVGAQWHTGVSAIDQFASRHYGRNWSA